jgi:hypothetical protein
MLRRWLSRMFSVYRVTYRGKKGDPVEPQWLVRVCGRRFVVRYCMTANGGW